MLKREREDDDFVGLSSSIYKYLSVDIDIKSLGVLDQMTSYKQNSSISDADYLHNDRCLAESRLIKTKIMYKLHEGINLTENESKYLQAWRNEMCKNQTLVKDCLVPKQPTSLNISDLE